MSKNKFIALCSDATIDPAIALENGDLAQALKDRNDAEVKRILEEEF